MERAGCPRKNADLFLALQVLSFGYSGLATDRQSIFVNSHPVVGWVPQMQTFRICGSAFYRLDVLCVSNQQCDVNLLF